ncbi:hypothetical protein HY970_00320 [Candidatus Kaiserbacteria bacterium]|nr:hypothetical protein [Candidatus Kaiserbacteria bacterium]
MVIAIAIIGSALYFATKTPEVASTNNVYEGHGQQIVEITAKGKYAPHLTAAKAGMPTVLRVKTDGTYDCTSQLIVPSMGYRQALPPTGMTDIQLEAQQPGATVRGVCAMGMYNFEIKFN